MLHAPIALVILFAHALAPIETLPSVWQQQPSAADAIAGQVAKAVRMQMAGDPGHSELLRQSASRFEDLNLRSHAQRALKLVIEKPETDFDLSEAHRMLAGSLLADGNIEQAIKSYQDQIAVFDANPALKQRFGVGYAGGVSQLAALLCLRGSLPEAEEVNDRLLGPDRSLFEPLVVCTALDNRAMIRTRMMNSAGAVEAIDDLLRECPSYGLADGRRISLQVRRLDLLFSDQTAPLYLAGLLEIWHDPQTAQSVHSLRLAGLVSQRLVAASRRNEAITIIEDSLTRLELNRKRWTLHPGSVAADRLDPAEIRRLEVALLSEICGADAFGRSDVALRASVRQLELAGTDFERRVISERIARLSSGTPKP